MATLIVYMTRHGCTEKTARLLEGHLEDDTTAVNLKKNKNPDLSAYETIIVGGSIHAGRIQREITKFCEKNRETLLAKRLGLFICHMQEGETAQKEFEDVYLEELRNHASAAGLFGGEFDFSRMNFLERGIVKKIAKIEESVSNIRADAIEEFAGRVNTA